MTLLVLAAGLGSRYGGLKQMDPMGPSGETVLDYSVYDALRAGFQRVVFVIRRDFEDEFRRVIGARFDALAPVSYAFQSIDRIPDDFVLPHGRSKPWGTGHALLCARDVVHEPFAVINADDFYGLPAYRIMRSFLAETPDRDCEGRALYGMAGYRLDRTLSEYGAVARGLCQTDSDGDLLTVTEITDIRSDGDGPYCAGPGGLRRSFTGQEMVSMNFWALRPSLFPLLEALFRTFLESSLTAPKSEFYIPTAIDALIRQNAIRVRLVPADSIWFGITYREDKPLVREKIRQLVESGAYPRNLWSASPVPAVR
ncbi:MAG TPA: nucleotidyltransferase [Verrucomicrobiales bacterium]|nr:nucleotidyltransferase [Verrucomicrobiales bacterium]